MSTIGSTSAASGTAQQDRIASGNSQHARRSSGDNKVFANMLSAAAENTSPEMLIEARKKEAGKRDDGDHQPEGDATPSNALVKADTPQAAQVTYEATPDEARMASDEPDGLTRRPARGGHNPVSTLALAGREPAALRSARGASAAPEHTTDGLAQGSAAPWAAPAELPGGATANPHLDSLTVALAAALEDALDVSDDVTLNAALTLGSQGTDGTNDAHAEVGAVADNQRAGADAPAGTEAPQAPAEAWQNAWADAMDRVGQQVSYWLGKGVSQAQLTVHGSQGEAVDVRVLLRDGQAHLEFASNNEATRAALAYNGADALRAVLGQSGIELVSLSVDTQASGGQNQHGQPPADGRPAADQVPGWLAAPQQGQEDTLPSGSVFHWTSNAVLDAYA
ncbi:MAG: flagellar hook-length control protein FliK [Hydrogenophaga sp.]|nr:flagellar hook-length control protein FliK [Hydrogenophaga sp.]